MKKSKAGKAPTENSAQAAAGAEVFNLSGAKYLREIHCIQGSKVDVYSVLEAFAVTCPARQHAIKKLLCTGLRGKGDVIQDLTEAKDAIDRAVYMEKARQAAAKAAQAATPEVTYTT